MAARITSIDPATVSKSAMWTRRSRRLGKPRTALPWKMQRVVCLAGLVSQLSADLRLGFELELACIPKPVDGEN